MNTAAPGTILKPQCDIINADLWWLRRHEAAGTAHRRLVGCDTPDHSSIPVFRRRWLRHNSAAAHHRPHRPGPTSINKLVDGGRECSSRSILSGAPAVDISRSEPWRRGELKDLIDALCNNHYMLRVLQLLDLHAALPWALADDQSQVTNYCELMNWMCSTSEGWRVETWTPPQSR